MATRLQGVDTLPPLPGPSTDVHVSRMSLYQRSVSRQNPHRPSSRASGLSADSLNTLNARWQSMLKAVSPIVSLMKQRAGKGTATSDVPSSSRLQRKKSFSSTANVQSFDRDASMRLEDYINLQHLQQLMEKFQVHRPTDQHGNTKIKREAGNMTLDEFKEAVSSTLGTPAWNDQIDALFKKMDTSCDGLIDWNEFCTYMLLQYRENDYMRTKRDIPFRSLAHIKHCVFNKQEPTTKLIYIENPSRYVSFSKEGVIGVWDTSVRLLKTYELPGEGDEGRNGKRQFKAWVTDAIYLPNMNKIVIATTSRDLHFFDISTSSYFEEFHLYGLADVPTCFDYHYDPKNPNTRACLLYGDESGCINLLYFKTPQSGQFERPFSHDEGIQKIYLPELPQHSKYVQLVVLDSIHPEGIRQILYCPHNDVVLSSSGSHVSSVVMMDISRKKKTYVFKVSKGVECFDYNKHMNIIVTGSSDHRVRLWNPYVTSKPITVLSGHHTTLIDVKLFEPMNQVFSYSKDAMLKVWDVKDHSCLQTVVLKFPCLVNGRIPEYGAFPLCLVLSKNTLLLTCQDYIGQLKLGVKKVKSTLPTTHNAPLCTAIYNPHYHQVVTGSDDSTVAVWDIETGNKSIMFTNAHGNEEITCMTFDTSLRRLITGARDGTIKIWNFQNGHNLHKLEGVGEAEVTGVIPLDSPKVILSVGWSRKIVLYDDSEADNMYVTANTSWKGGQAHKDDILCVAHCAPNLLATASFDGDLIVWSMETQKIFLRLRKGHHSRNSRRQSRLPASAAESLSSQDMQDPQQPQEKRRKRSRHSYKGPTPVDQLLFLPKRATGRPSDCAILISSEAGTINWWCIYGTKHHMGYFYAPDTEEESVLGLATSPDNNVLVTGDTMGYIAVWDITDYCVKMTDNLRRVKSRPPRLAFWRAHHSAVASVEYVDHEVRPFVVSAGTDKTARLWTIEGHYVGTFGQDKKWNLKRPSTYEYPNNPWLTPDTEHSIPGQAGDNASGPSVQQVSDDKDDSDNVEQAAEDSEAARVENGPMEAELMFVDEEEREDEGEGDDVAQLPVMPVSRGLPGPAQPVKRLLTSQSDDIAVRGLRGRAHTFSTLKYTTRSQSFIMPRTLLGHRVEENLHRKIFTRQERRSHYGDINVKATAPLGTQCSPFQALSMPELQQVYLPSSLPMSPRMVSRGMAATTESELGDLPLAVTPVPDDNDYESVDRSSVSQGSKRWTAGRKVTSLNKLNKLPAIKSVK
ncbi:EFCAB8 [Branchiostoma lanceolatum]|uniref:EFCAB8 protein n=1 Tax=Branchiostoma lanceolatum TaxID=7740 RepID=A0A8K0AHD8_BRALA|nr:EFCAB8 [Branchiostoma lanceolatum]